MFKLNQKVVCIDATNTPQLKENEIYTISSLADVPDEGFAVTLKEAEPSVGFKYFTAIRFREIDDKFASDILSYIEEEIMETYI